MMVKNKEKIRRKSSLAIERGADQATRWIGSTKSLVAHSILFIGFLVLIVFGVKADTVMLILTTIVSLEAIYLSIFIQMSVNRQAHKLEAVSEDIEDIQEDMEEIQKDVEGISEDVEEIQKDVEEISEDIEEIEKDVDEIQKDVDEIQEDVEEINEDEEVNPNPEVKTMSAVNQETKDETEEDERIIKILLDLEKQIASLQKEVRSIKAESKNKKEGLKEKVVKLLK